jgi:putative peptide zinc metalloprotease protein
MQAEALPRLREDLRLIERPRRGATAHWVIEDKLRDSFFQIGFEGFQLVSLWPLARTASDLSKLVLERFGRLVDAQEIGAFARFLSASQLTEEPINGWRELAQAAAAKHGSLAKQALHNYLFFRIPLVRPAAFLKATLPLAALFVAPLFLLLHGLAWAAGLYLAARQWEVFAGDLARQISWSGAMLFAVTLFVMKIFHELGHAYVATAKGARVRGMGIAVMLMAPMLYTDVTDSWRLPDRRDRMMIDAAGIAVEMMIAGWAMLLWAILPPGEARDVLLVICTAAVFMTLAINLSPFMRFDGYFMLADALGVTNLQPRGFALARWKLRDWLFGLNEPSRDIIHGPLRSIVIAYGFATMLYRLVLFIGIALAVYAMFFKLAGVILFIIEIFVFIAAPVWREAKVWWRMREPILISVRTLLSTAVLAVLVALALIPWSGRITVPAVMEPADYARIFPREAGEVAVVHVRRGDVIAKGTRLVTLRSRALEQEDAIARAQLTLVEERLARRLGDQRDAAESLSLEQEKLAVEAKIRTIASKRAGLAVISPIAGKVIELTLDLSTGRMIARDEEIALVVGQSGSTAVGYIAAGEQDRLSSGAAGRFVPDDPVAAPVDMTLALIAPDIVENIDQPLLADTQNGPIRTQSVAGGGAVVPVDPIRRVYFSPAHPTPIERPMRGVVILHGEPRSFAAFAWQRLLMTLVRESGA